MAASAEPCVDGEAILYRLFDVGYEIQLEEALEHLLENAPERSRPARSEAGAIQIPNPPVRVVLGTEPVTIGGRTCDAELSARLFDFGVVSLRARIRAPHGLPWSEFCEFGAAVVHAQLGDRMDSFIGPLLQRVGAAVVRPGRSAVTEEYTIFRTGTLVDREGRKLPVGALTDDAIARLLLSDRRPLAPGARADLLSPRFSYYEDDLTVLAWSAALVVEPVAEDTDVQYVLEFANAQLLELRYYDTLLDAELPRLYDEINSARRAFHFLGRRFSRLLAILQSRVADVTESVERAEHSLKMTNDVYLARVYSTALEIFRGSAWRRGIDRKIEMIRDAYTMLNAESQARRAEIMELIIIALIAFEIVMAMVR